MPPPSGPYRFGGPGPPGVRVRLPINKRIKVYWSGMKQWYAGTICDWDASKGLHFIHYDDGEIYRIKLGNTIWDWEDSEAPPLKLTGNVKSTPVKRRPKFKQNSNRQGKDEEKDDQLLLLGAKADINSDTEVEDDEDVDAGGSNYHLHSNGKRTRRPSALMKEIYGEPSSSKERISTSLDDGETLVTNGGPMREASSHVASGKHGGPSELRRNTGSKSGRCHQCHRDKRGEVARCKTCNHFRFCTACIANRYNLTKEEVEEKCPKCRGSCNCGRCMSYERAVKEPKMQQQVTNTSPVPLFMRRQAGGRGGGNRVHRRKEVQSEAGPAVSTGDEPVLQDLVSQLGCLAHSPETPQLQETAAATVTQHHSNPILSETSPMVPQGTVYTTPVEGFENWNDTQQAGLNSTAIKDEVDCHAVTSLSAPEVILLDQVLSLYNGNNGMPKAADPSENGQGESKGAERPKVTKVRTRTTNENLDLERLSRLRRGGMMPPPRESRQASLVYHSSAEVRFVGPLKRPLEVSAKFASSRPRSVRHTDRAADSRGTAVNEVELMDSGARRRLKEEEEEGSCRNGTGKEIVLLAGEQHEHAASPSPFCDDCEAVEMCEGEVESNGREGSNKYPRKRVRVGEPGRGEIPSTSLAIDMTDDGNDLAAEALIGMATSPGLTVPEVKHGFSSDALVLSTPPVVMPSEPATSAGLSQNLVVVREEEMVMAALRGDKEKRNAAYLRVHALGGVEGFLRSLALERYDHIFKENEVMDDTLPLLTSQDLRDMGVVSVGARRKILTGIQDLWNQESYTA